MRGMLCVVRLGDDMDGGGHFDSGEANEADGVMWRMSVGGRVACRVW